MPLTIGRKLGHGAIGACVALISEVVRADPLPPTMQTILDAHNSY